MTHFLTFLLLLLAVSGLSALNFDHAVKNLRSNVYYSRNSDNTAEIFIQKLSKISIFEFFMTSFEHLDPSVDDIVFPATSTPSPPPFPTFQNLQNLTDNCYADISLLFHSFKNNSLAPNDFYPVLLKIVDAQGIIPSGTLRGVQNVYGFKQECDLVKYSVPNTTRVLETSYSRMYLDPASLSGKNHTCESDSVFVGYDVCMPKSCGKEDLTILVLNLNLFTVYYPDFEGDNPACSVTTLNSMKMPYTWKSYLVMAVFSIVCAIGVLSTVLDYFVIPPNHEKRSERPFNLLLAFSIYTNISEIMTVKKSNQSGQISSIHFIRVISIIWVMTAHTFLMFESISNNNMDVLTLVDYPLTQLLVNGFYSVDNFFFIGAVLLSFIFFKELDRNRQNVMSLQSWFMFYFHRYVRLSPSYFMAMAVHTYIYYRWSAEHVYKFSKDIPEDVCDDYFWYHVLYINNIDELKNCFGHTWYLAADMQMYVASPVILVSLAMNQTVGIIIALFLLALSTAANIVTVYVNHYPPAFPVTASLDPHVRNFDKYYDIMYYAFWIRCQIYIIGILVGYLLQKKKRLHIPAIVQVTGWILTISLMGTVLFGLFDYNRNEVTVSLFWSAMYSALSRIAWGLGLGWIVVACFYGYGGFLNRFMSWNIWVPISRLSYAAYLIHINVIDYVYMSSDHPYLFTTFGNLFMFYVTPVIGLTFFLSLFWSSLFEISVAKVETILLRRKKRDSSKAHIVQNDRLNNPENVCSDNQEVIVKKL